MNATPDASRRDNYLSQYADTDRFSRGAPKMVGLSEDGLRVFFLRSGGPTDGEDHLWVCDATTGHTRQLSEGQPVIGGYALNQSGTAAAYRTRDGLRLVDAVGGTSTALPAALDVADPRPDPTGRLVAYVGNGDLRVTGADGDRVLASSTGPTTRWGEAELVAAAEFGRNRGFWWAPDGGRLIAARVGTGAVTPWHLADPEAPAEPPRVVRYPCAGAANADVSLHLIDLAGHRRAIDWDNARFPYLHHVSWSAGRPPLLLVLDRAQRVAQVLQVEVPTGETSVLHEDADDRWLAPVPGTPCWSPGGGIVRSVDTAGTDCRQILVDDRPATPAWLYVRAVVGALGEDLVVIGSGSSPAEQHVYQIRPGGGQPERLTGRPGWHDGLAAAGTLVVGSALQDAPGVRWTIHGPNGEHRLADQSAVPACRPAPVLARVGERRIPAAVLFPRDHRPGNRLPVLVQSYGGPGQQEVRAGWSPWLNRQWWADQGYAVVTIDGRGTPGVSPAWEKAVWRRLADVVLADQVDTLHHLGERHPDLDLSRVGIRGSSFGGFLAALAVLRRPDVFHVASAIAPVTDWSLYDSAYSERYLGLPADGTTYQDNSLIGSAAALRRPLLLVQGLLDDNVLPVHAFRLSAELLAARRPHRMMSLGGVGHVPSAAILAGLLPLERQFFDQALKGSQVHNTDV